MRPVKTASLWYVGRGEAAMQLSLNLPVPETDTDGTATIARAETMAQKILGDWADADTTQVTHNVQWQ